MKTNRNYARGIFRQKPGRLVILLATVIATMLTATLRTQAQVSPNGDWTDGFDNSTLSAQDSTASWIYWYNGGGSVSLDTSVFKSGTGSLMVNIPFDNAGTANVGQGAWFGNFDNAYPYNSDVLYDGTQFTNIVFDILMDVSDPTSPSGDFGTINVGLLDKGTPAGARSAGSVTIPASASNSWFHVVVPVNKSALYLSAPGVIGVSFTYSKYANSFLNSPVVLHLDNLKVQLGAVSNPPPVVSIKAVTPGLNFVQGSISGQYDRQNIITANGANSTANYSWAGATPSSPVTYAFTIAKFAAPDLNFHIYFYQTAGAGGASAPDYNQPNVLIFQVNPSGAGASVSLTWKTNSPSSGTIGTAFSTNTATLLGTWQLKFTSATGGDIIAPDATVYPFNIDPSLAVNIANPITVNFGLNPGMNDPKILGESVVISQISITGVDALSANYATNDNFLADSALDTTTWTVNALFPNSILFVPATTTWSVAWTLPAVGFSLEVNPSLTGSSAWIAPASLAGVTLFPGQTTLVPNSALPAGGKAFFRLAKLTPTKLQVLLPGETNAPGTLTGKVGTPTPVTAFEPVTVTVNEVDASFNIVGSGDTLGFTSTDGGLTIPSGTLTLVNGTYSGTFYFGTTGSQTITASDSTDTKINSNTSSAVTVQ